MDHQGASCPFFHADMFCYTRVGVAIAQPGTTLFAWDVDLWNRNVSPNFMKAKDLIAGIRAVRGYTAALAQSVPAGSWDAAIALHPKRGPITLADILGIYTGHAGFHIEYLERNLAAM